MDITLTDTADHPNARAVLYRGNLAGYVVEFGPDLFFGVAHASEFNDREYGINSNPVSSAQQMVRQLLARGWQNG